MDISGKGKFFIQAFIFWNLSCALAETNTTQDLTEAESGRNKLEIVKQIKKINNDGSYTIGYEADDGSFKIESRDVLGNIKGTYGYIEGGEIKRVTYSTKNDSDAKLVAPTVVQRIPRTNRTYTSVTRKQERGTTTPNPSVIQSIPRRRFVFPIQSSTVSTTKSTSSKPINVIYAHSVAKQEFDSDGDSKHEGQLSRPEAEITASTETSLQKHTLEASLSEADSTIKPVTEEPEVHGNTLRRQLLQERKPEFDPRQHVLTLQQGSDLSDVYSGSKTTGTPRPPLFTTTYRSRVLPQATTTRPFNSTPFIIKPSQTTSSPGQQEVIPEYPQDQTTTEAVDSGEDFRTQLPIQALPIPPFLNSQQRLAAVQHPTNGEIILVPAGHPILSQFHINKESYVNTPVHNNGNSFQDPIPVHTQQRGNPIRIIQGPPILRPLPVQDNRVSADSNVIYGRLVPINQPSPVRFTNSEQTLQRQIDDIEPPVSINDFQKILDQLIMRQKKLEMVHALVNARAQEQIPRPSVVVFQQRLPYQEIPPQYRSREYESSFPIQDPPTQIYSPTKRMVAGNGIDRQDNEERYLPPQIRETLLLKMLKLAINPHLPLEVDTEGQYSITSTPAVIKTGQRNVEILGEEADEEEPRIYRRSKRFPEENVFY